MDDNIKYEPTNRSKRLAPKTGKHWCMICDMAMVGRGGKCKYCGTKQLPRRLKR